MSRPDLDHLWHAAYRRWYDHDRADHSLRAGAWGTITDRLARAFDRLGLWGRP